MSENKIVNEWIVKTLAPAINRLDIDNIYLICDKSRFHNKVNIMEVLKAVKCKFRQSNLASIQRSSSKSISNDNKKSSIATFRNFFPRGIDVCYDWLYM